jgi:DNA-binding GntR family transcriptional regulator
LNEVEVSPRLNVSRGPLREALKAAKKDHDLTRYTALNVQLRDAMVTGVGNQHLIETYRHLVRQLGLLRQAAIESEKSAPATSVAEYEKMVNALAKSDAERAVTPGREHVAHGPARMRQAHERWAASTSSTNKN